MKKTKAPTLIQRDDVVSDTAKKLITRKWNRMLFK